MTMMDNNYSYDYQFRLIVVGDSTVGKVCRFDLLGRKTEKCFLRLFLL